MSDLQFGFKEKTAEDAIYCLISQICELLNKKSPNLWIHFLDVSKAYACVYLKNYIY